MANQGGNRDQQSKAGQQSHKNEDRTKDQQGSQQQGEDRNRRQQEEDDAARVEDGKLPSWPTVLVRDDAVGEAGPAPITEVEAEIFRAENRYVSELYSRSLKNTSCRPISPRPTGRHAALERAAASVG